MNLMYAQFVGVGAILFGILSTQCRKKKNILLFLLVSYVFYTVTYFLLDANPAGLISLIITGCYFIYLLYEKDNSKISVLWPILFSLIVITSSIYFNFSYYYILFSLIGLIYIIFGYIKDMITFKTILILCSIALVFFNIKTQGYICSVGNVVQVILLLINIFKI